MENIVCSIGLGLLVILLAPALFSSIANIFNGSEITNVVVPEPSAAVSNDIVIYIPQVFESLFRDLMTVIINNQEQQNVQFKIIQAQIDFINTTLFHCGVGIFTLVVCGLGYYFVYNNPNINIPELVNNIYTQINNQCTYISNQTFQFFNRILGINNLEIPIVHAEIVNQNVQQIDNGFLDIIAEDVVNNIQNQEINRLLDIILNDRTLAYITDVANVNLTDAHIIGQILLQNNGII